MKPQKQRKHLLSPNGIEEVCRRIYATYRPPLTAGQQRRLRVLHIADLKRQIAAIKGLPYRTPTEEEELDQTVRWLLRRLHRELETERNDSGEPPRSQILYGRWSLVAWAHNERGVSWREAYELASKVLGNSSFGGTPRTMKEAYQAVQRIRRAVQRAKREAQPNWAKKHPLKMS
jgi:hypothetical protein